MKKSGWLAGVGVGPGDPELITVKALRRINEADVIAYFRAARRESNSRRIVSDLVRGDQPELQLVYPVTTETLPDDVSYEKLLIDFYDESATKLATELDAGRNVVVLCEGDPLFFGSFMYLRNRLCNRYETEVIPGVTSVGGASALLGMPLVCRDEMFCALSGVLPADDLKTRLAEADAAVVMKLGRNLAKVRGVIEELGLLDRAYYVERATMTEQKVSPLAEADAERAPYFSMVVIPSIEAGLR